MEYADCKDFADICKVMGKNVNDYDIVSSASAKENANMYHNRLMLIAKCANGDGVVDLTDSNAIFYTPYHYKNKKVANSHFGFCLSSRVFDRSGPFLGSRPPFLLKEHALFAGKTFVAEFEGWLYYLNKAYQEI